MSTNLDIDLEGTELNAFVKAVQEDFMTDTVKHIDFYEVLRGKLLQTKVKVVLEGTPAGVRNGGVLEHVLYEAEVECFSRNLPDAIKVNVENLDVNETLLVQDLPQYEGVKVLDDPEATVATIKFVKEEAPQAAESEAPSADAAAPAQDASKDNK